MRALRSLLLVAALACAREDLPADLDSAANALLLTSVTAGRNFTCGLRADSTATCWGANENGQLGTTKSPEECDIDWGTARGPCSVRPVAVAGAHKFVSLDAGDDHACALTPDGSAFCWGRNESGELGNFESGETCSVDKYVKLGYGSSLCSREPRAVTTALRFVSITAGRGFTCGLTLEGTAHCWGNWTRGRLGGIEGPIPHGPIAHITAPVPFVQVSAVDEACALANTGRVFCWGGSGRAVATLVHSDVAFASISVGLGYVCGVARDSTAYCKGENDSGQRGDGTVVRRYTPDSTWHAVVGGLRFRTVTAGMSATCGVTLDRATYCWGHGDVLGARAPDRCFHVDAFSPCALQPTRSPLNDVVATTSSYIHGCAVLGNATTYCWGSNRSHESSASNRERLSRPVLVVR